MRQTPITKASEAATRRVLRKKMFLKISQNSQGNSCARVSSYNFIKKETLTQVFSCEFCEISKNICFTEHLQCLLLKLVQDSSNGTPRNNSANFE